LFFRWPRLSKAELDELYKEADLDHWRYESDNRVDWQIAARWLNRNSFQGTILDIGCFGGEFLECLGEGWGKYGVEINKGAVRRAGEKGISILCDNFEQISGISMQFDVVSAFDVIEHMGNPRYMLEQMARLTRKGGTIVLSSGNSLSASWRFMGSKYWYCFIPEHISFINEKWSVELADKLNLDVVHGESFAYSKRKRTLSWMALDLIVNIAYKYAPHVVGVTRKNVFHMLGSDRFNSMKYRPPTWTSAKDHFIMFLRKK
jgi:2-polyprenyl-3-methyl-5-hydroxy-6-metoxy-1,4-benzoquinol methylase